MRSPATAVRIGSVRCSSEISFRTRRSDSPVRVGRWSEANKGRGRVRYSAVGSLPSSAPVLAPPAGGRDECLLDVTQGRRARAAASTRLVTSSSCRRMSERWTLDFLVADEQLVPISPLDRPQASSASTSWSRGVRPSATARSSSRRGSRVRARRRADGRDGRDRSMAISSGVASSSWAAAQAAPRASVAARRTESARPAVPARSASAWQATTSRRLACGHIALPLVHAPSDADTEPARLRTRGELAHQARRCRLPPHPRSTPRPNPARPRRATAARRAISPSRPTNLRPVARAPMSPYSRTRPGCHDTQASLRLVDRATADSWRPAVARAARCPGVPLRRRGLSIDDRLSVDMQRQRPLPRTRPRTEHRRAGIRKPAG